MVEFNKKNQRLCDNGWTVVEMWKCVKIYIGYMGIPNFTCYSRIHFHSWSKTGFIDSLLHKSFCQSLIALTDYSVSFRIDFVEKEELAKDPVMS